MGQEASSKKPLQDVPASVPHPGRQGTCRLCFEQGGDLIAPCECKGTSKWIHRDCLNRWRVAGSNPMSLTNCCECGFQYHLDLHRVISTEGEERQRQFIRRVASQGFLTFAAVQLAICFLGLLIRLLDHKERLVSNLNLTALKFWHPYNGLCATEVYPNLWRSLKCHKSEYYLVSLCILLAFVGLVAILAGFFSCLPSPGRTVLGNGYCYYPCTDCCYACGEGCAWGCDVGHCAAACGDCGKCCDDNAASSSNKDCMDAGVWVVILLAVFLAFVIIGLFITLIVIVGAIQKAVQHYAKLQQIKVLAQEYVVRDLADPSDHGDGDVASSGIGAQEYMAPSPRPEQALRPLDPEMQQRLQVLISKDVHAIFNGPDPQQALRTHRFDKSNAYGSV